MLRFDGKIIFVTGCGSAGAGVGNGKAICILFARQGGTVYGVDVNLAAAQETARTIEKEGHSITVSQCDVRNAAQIAAAVDSCISKFGRIDVLVNNVGLSASGDAINMSEQVWDSQIDVNLKSVYLCCKMVLPIMEKQTLGGAVVNLSSVAGIRHLGEHIAYAASKAAVIQYTRSTAVACALKRNNIRLNTVLPGLMNTPLVRERILKQSGGRYEDLVARRGAQVPGGSMGDGWDVAHAVLFLASAEAKYITGTELVVDGGLTVVAGAGKPKLA